MVTIAQDLVLRACIITAVFAILSYVIVERYQSSSLLEADVPALFIIMGVVMLISILFDLWRFKVWSASARLRPGS